MEGEVDGVATEKEALEVEGRAGQRLGQMEVEEAVGQKVGLKVGHIPRQAMVEVKVTALDTVLVTEKEVEEALDMVLVMEEGMEEALDMALVMEEGVE